MPIPNQKTPSDKTRQKETGVAKPVNIGSVTPDNIRRKPHSSDKKWVLISCENFVKPWFYGLHRGFFPAVSIITASYGRNIFPSLSLS